VAFARVGPRGVEGNLAAAAWYRTLGPAAAAPALAGEAAPRWQLASREPSFGWFDPRLDARTPTPSARRRSDTHPHGDAHAAPRRFAIPLRVDGAPVALNGRFVAKDPAAGHQAACLTSPAEPAPGVRVTLLPGRAPGLLVHNATQETLLVLGAGGEPFLRIGRGGVDANLRSETWQRSARAAAAPFAPPAASHAQTASDPSGAAVWQRVAQTARFGWIEPRAVWEDPRETAAPGAAPRERGWQVPMQLGERQFVVTGAVAWRPLSHVAQSSAR
jgi:hypothetical protein